VKRGLSLLFLLPLFGSCVSNPGMEKFPDRRIDRNLSNSEKITSWSTIGAGRLSRSTSGEVSNKIPVPWPFSFENPAVENALSGFDRGLLGVSVPVRNEDENFLVVALGWAPSTEAIFGYNNQYSLGLVRRQLVNQDSALDYGIAVTDIMFDAGFSIVLYRLGLSTELQITDFLWIKPGVSAYLFDVPDYSTVVGNLKYKTKSGISAEYPIRFEWAMDPNKHWGLRSGYSLSWLGRANNSWDQQYYLGFSVNF